MEEDIFHIHNRHGVKYNKLIITLYTFIVIASNSAASGSSATACILNFASPSSSYNVSCGDRDWSGFVNNNCCTEAFRDYLWALAQRANQTGEIFLNSTEQRICLTTMQSKDADLGGCGIENLTRGTGGCSNFSVDDATDRFGDQIKTLRENCKLVYPGSENEDCGTCLKSWEDLRGMSSGGVEPLEAESDTCRFAALVAFISTKIEDGIWFHKISKCLWVRGRYKDFVFSAYVEEEEGKENKRIVKKNDFVTGLYALIGSTVGILMMAAITICILSQRWHKSNVSEKKDAVTLTFPKDLSCLKVPIKEVYSATDNLNETNFIGEGTTGKVYKGTMSNNQHVAVKHIMDDGCVESFLREVRSISLVRHPNLVALLGYCESTDECFVVYELCPNGSLSDWLFGKDKVLTWRQRLQIAIDSAQGLKFLHTYPEGCIVHRDIKPTNILLGRHFEAKLSDFGLSKIIDLGETSMSSEVRGTFGYVDPEYQSNRQVNSASDVYSFGIVLLQILSGRKVINMNMKKPMPLNKMARSLTKEGSIIEFADPKLEGGFTGDAFDLIFNLAMSCTEHKQQRPSMDKVVEKLEEALDISIRANASTQTTPSRSLDSPKQNS